MTKQSHVFKMGALGKFAASHFALLVLSGLMAVMLTVQGGFAAGAAQASPSSQRTVVAVQSGGGGIGQISDWSARVDAWQKANPLLAAQQTAQLSKSVISQLQRKPQLIGGAKEGMVFDTRSVQARKMGKATLVTYRIVGSSTVAGSSLGVTLNAAGSIIATQQVILRDMKLQDRGRLTTYVNGKRTSDVVVLASGKTLPVQEGSRAVKQGSEVAGWSFRKFNKCLADKGVSAWAVTGISVACGFVCAGTAGAGCYACLFAAGYVTYGTVTWCIGKART